MDVEWFSWTKETSWFCTKLNCSVREAPRYINGRRQIHLAGCAGLWTCEAVEVWSWRERRHGAGWSTSMAGCHARAVTREGFHVSGAAKHSTTEQQRTGDLRSCWHQHARLARPCRALASLRPQPRGGALSRSLPTAHCTVVACVAQHTTLAMRAPLRTT